MHHLKKLQQQLGYLFKDDTLLLQALTHRSKQKTKHNERLEFLGDSVLSLVISTEIFKRYQKLSEGDLSRLRAALVKGETIAKMALQLNIDAYLSLGVGELKSGGKQRESILSGAFESIIGAIYLDANFEVARECVLRWYGELIEKIDHETDVKDAKTTLQEWLQARQMMLPTYTCVTTGEAHALQFEVTCSVKGVPYKTQGVSTNRRKAEQIAAKLFFKKLSTQSRNHDEH